MLWNSKPKFKLKSFHTVVVVVVAVSVLALGVFVLWGFPVLSMWQLSLDSSSISNPFLSAWMVITAELTIAAVMFWAVVGDVLPQRVQKLLSQGYAFQVINFKINSVSFSWVALENFFPMFSSPQVSSLISSDFLHRVLLVSGTFLYLLPSTSVFGVGSCLVCGDSLGFESKQESKPARAVFVWSHHSLRSIPLKEL